MCAIFDFPMENSKKLAAIPASLMAHGTLGRTTDCSSGENAPHGGKSVFHAVSQARENNKQSYLTGG